MTNTEFKYWIKGYLQLTSETLISSNQIKTIKNHANLTLAVTGYLDIEINHFIQVIEKNLVDDKIDFIIFKQIALDKLNIEI